MRLAILSDIHANLEALVEVEAAVRALGAEHVVCLGDVVGYGASPVACCARTRALAEVTLLGNHDAAVAGRMDYGYYYDAARHALDWTAAQLDPFDRRWLAGLPYSHRIGDVELCHGAPLDPAAYDYVFALEQAEELAPQRDRLAPVTFIGHSHLCKAFAFDDDGKVEELSGERLELRRDRKYIISVGSVGQPRDYDPRACFATYDGERRVVQMHRVAYDVRASARRILDAGLAPNFGKRLFVGV